MYKMLMTGQQTRRLLLRHRMDWLLYYNIMFLRRLFSFSAGLHQTKTSVSNNISVRSTFVAFVFFPHFAAPLSHSAVDNNLSTYLQTCTVAHHRGTVSLPTPYLQVTAEYIENVHDAYILHVSTANGDVGYWQIVYFVQHCPLTLIMVGFIIHIILLLIFKL